MKRTVDITDSFLQTRGRTWSALPAHHQERIVEEAFAYWRKHGFPYYQLTQKQVGQEFFTLRGKDWKSVFTVSGLRASNTGLRLANAFQRGMWTARVHRFRSPMDVFNDDGLLRRAIARALSIWPDRFGANASCLRRILKSFSDTASVSNYRPVIAKGVIARYSSEGPVIDFSAGYGGRLLGALAMNRSYVGIEPNPDQIAGFRRMISALTRLNVQLPDVRLVKGVAEKELRKFASGSADLVFSSPPFFDWERYSELAEQSFKRFPDYPSWSRNFMTPVIFESYRILCKGGHLAINVTNGKRLPSADHVKEIAIKVGFRLSVVHQMLVPKVPYLHPRNGNAVKTELLMIFHK